MTDKELDELHTWMLTLHGVTCSAEGASTSYYLGGKKVLSVQGQGVMIYAHFPPGKTPHTITLSEAKVILLRVSLYGER